MLAKLLLSIIVAMAIMGVRLVCHCNEHTYESLLQGDKVLFDKVLYEKNITTPKNYTLIFKYMAPEFSPTITHAKFNVLNTNSNGSIEVNAEAGKDKTLQATFSIFNATNIKVVGTIYGSSLSLFNVDSLTKMTGAGGKASIPKTFTVVYGHNATQTRNRKVSLGQRQTGDKMIAFQTKNVTFSYRFAETEFTFHDNQKHITSVGFSFDSPTAIAFVNSTYIREDGINVIAYDLNSSSFIANMSVYGYDDFDKPATYKRIVGSKAKQMKL